MSDDDEGRDLTARHRSDSTPSNQHVQRGPSAASASGGPSSAPTPDDVLRLLESCQLTDEEADELLKDAYALNRLLRAHLAHVEASNGAGSREQHRRESGGPQSTSASSSKSKTRQSSSGSGFSRQLGGGAVRHEQSVSRRSVSLSGRTQVSGVSSSQQQQQQRLPPIARAKSPGQRLSEMARAYSSGVIQARHRRDDEPAADVVKSANKRL